MPELKPLDNSQISPVFCMSDDVLVWLRSQVRSVDDIDRKIQAFEKDIAFLRHQRAVQMRSRDIVAGLPQEILLMIFKHLPLRRKWLKAPSPMLPWIHASEHNSQSSRIRRLDLELYEPPEFLDTINRSNFPILENLTITSLHPPRLDSTTKLDFSPELNAASAIATLRYLELRRIGVKNIASPCFSDLSTLKLVDLTLPDKPAFTDLIHGLERMSRLENLVLDHAIRTGTVENMNQTNLLLPSLISLKLRDNVRNIEALLKLISSKQIESIQIHSIPVGITTKCWLAQPEHSMI
ncbi:hypothetical protein ONZ45_g8379 [Pleurotus djamor]|nr:hypothetical protein ONZ45_g8379 [Pleurotus djamor]